MYDALKRHWPEYLMEAAGLGLFMMSAGVCATMLEYSGSAVREAIPDPALRRMLMGIAMGLTAIGIIYSPWGKQSGAHINPSITLTFFRLGKISPWDTALYVGAQFAGGIAGMLLVSLLIGRYLAEPSINFVATVPGPNGHAMAFAAELVISFCLMLVILFSTNTQRLASWTGVFAGLLIATFITLEAPLSGMSINPARTLASALSAWLWTGLWIYFTAPVIGMLIAAESYLFLRGKPRVFCAKLHHQNNKRCIFRCGYHKEDKGGADR